MLSLIPRLKETQRARASTVSMCPRLDWKKRLIRYQKLQITNSIYSVLSDDLESDGPNALRYVPGKARSHHLEMMMSKEELEEEQRSVKTANISHYQFILAPSSLFLKLFSIFPCPLVSTLLIPFTLLSRVCVCVCLVRFTAMFGCHCQGLDSTAH